MVHRPVQEEKTAVKGATRRVAGRKDGASEQVNDSCELFIILLS
jgi:hypothetical protein